LIGITLPLWSTEDSQAGGKIRPCNHYLMLHASVGTSRKSFWLECKSNQSRAHIVASLCKQYQVSTQQLLKVCTLLLIS
jgi:hypothetical protein